MNKATLSLAAALMLSAAPLSMTAAYAQGRDDGEPSMKQGGGDRPTREEQRPAESGASEKGSDRGAANERGTKGDERASDSSKGDAKEKSANRGEDSTKRQSEDRSDKPAKRQSEDKSQQPSSDKADSSASKKSQDAADAKKDDNAKRKPDADKRDDRSQSAEQPKPDDSKQSAGNAAKTEKAKSADLSGDKRDRVKTSFKSENVKELTNVNVNISVGRRLPRDWDYRPVPQAVIAIVPEYSGYRYVYVEDRYVIVDPDTYEVVYVFDETGGGSASVGRSTGEGGADRCSTSLTLTEEDRMFVLEKVRTQSSSVRVGKLEIGVELPGDTHVEAFPSEVTTRVTKLDGCRYVFVDDKIAVVDPTNEKIVAIIEQ